MNLPARIMTGIIGGLICAGLIYYVNKDRPGLSQRARVIAALIMFVAAFVIMMLMGGVRYA